MQQQHWTTISDEDGWLGPFPHLPFSISACFCRQRSRLAWVWVWVSEGSVRRTRHTTSSRTAGEGEKLIGKLVSSPEDDGSRVFVCGWQKACHALNLLPGLHTSL